MRRLTKALIIGAGAVYVAPLVRQALPAGPIGDLIMVLGGSYVPVVGLGVSVVGAGNLLSGQLSPATGGGTTSGW